MNTTLRNVDSDAEIGLHWCKCDGGIENPYDLDQDDKFLSRGRAERRHGGLPTQSRMLHDGQRHMLLSYFGSSLKDLPVWKWGCAPNTLGILGEGLTNRLNYPWVCFDFPAPGSPSTGN